MAVWLVAAACARADPALDLRTERTWRVSAPWFGGFSGIELSSDGAALTAITDRGSLVRAAIERDAAGDIRKIGAPERVVMRLRDGTAFPHSFRDAEGLAIGADGAVHVSFELWHRVMRIDPESGITSRLALHPDFETFDRNGGLEALAVHPDGSLYAVLENRRGGFRPTPIYRWRDGAWQVAFRLNLTRPFVPVGADFDPQGRLYLLERGLSPLGFRSRIRRLDLDADAPRSEVLLTTIPGVYDNLEGISVWRDARGRTRLTLISDDNFLPVQLTQIVEFVLSD